MSTPHLDDEQLSALIDGAGTVAAHDGQGGVESLDETDGHLASCAACRRRLEALRQVSDVVATPPVPVPELQRQAAVRVATRAALAEQRTVRRERPNTKALPWLAAAAVVAMLVGAVAALPRMWTDQQQVGESGGDVAASRRLDDSAEFSQAAPGPASGLAADAAYDYLGPHDDAGTLAAVVAGRIDAMPAALAPAEGGGGAPATTAGARQKANTEATCARDARRLEPPVTDPLVYRATADWRGERAEVLVFGAPRPAGEPAAGTRDLVVMSLPGCRLLARGTL